MLLAERLKALSRTWFEPSVLTGDVIFALLSTHAAGQLASEGIVPVMRHLLERVGGDEDETFVNRLHNESDDVIKTALSDLNLTPLSADEAENRVAAAWASAADRTFPTIQHRRRFVMGELMNDLRGRFEGRRLAEFVDAHVTSHAGAEGATG